MIFAFNVGYSGKAQSDKFWTLEKLKKKKISKYLTSE